MLASVPSARRLAARKIYTLLALVLPDPVLFVETTLRDQCKGLGWGDKAMGTGSLDSSIRERKVCASHCVAVGMETRALFISEEIRDLTFIVQYCLPLYSHILRTVTSLALLSYRCDSLCRYRPVVALSAVSTQNWHSNNPALSLAVPAFLVLVSFFTLYVRGQRYRNSCGLGADIAC